MSEYIYASKRKIILPIWNIRKNGLNYLIDNQLQFIELEVKHMHSEI